MKAAGRNRENGTMVTSRWNLKQKMLGGLFSVLIVVFLLITALFLQTSERMREEYEKMTANQAEKIMKDIDEVVSDIYNVSDNFAANEQLDEYIEREYGPEENLVKKADTVMLYKKTFASYDMLKERQKMAAIYTYKGVLFNIKDANWDGPEVIGQLEALGVNDPDHLMRFYWYPLRENFLESYRYGEVRKDKAVIGARRVYSTLKAGYVCVHIFTLQEREIYELYQEAAGQLRGEVHIINSRGELISSSREDLVEAGALPEELREQIAEQKNGKFRRGNGRNSQIVYISPSEVNDWMTVVMVPERAVTRDVDLLYRNIFLVLGCCLVVCTALILKFYRGFIGPINDLNAAMTEVYAGNLSAYVDVRGKNEVGDMGIYFNSMLKSINTHVVEKLEAEQRKKELELEVLMSQINPHFLYNTLENIVWKSSEAGHPDIGRIAASLGRMYRLSISGGDVIVPMQHEIEHLMAYIHIQKNRWKDAFQFDLQTDRVPVKQLSTLKILLQPVVENAFLYGMPGAKKHFMIRLKMREAGEQIEIRVIDNGAGMGKERLEEVRDQIRNGRKQQETESNRRSTGIGLPNVAARITLYFGITEPVRIYSREGMGTITILRIARIEK